MTKTRKDYLFVGIQILLFFGFIMDVEVLRLEIPVWVRVSGAVLFIAGFLISGIAVLQLSTNLSPFPSPKTDAELVRSGLYKFIRHPIYTGIIFAGFGLGLATDSGFRLIVAGLLWLLFYLKSGYEEERLKTAYRDYEDYSKQTGRFLPKIRLRND